MEPETSIQTPPVKRRRRSFLVATLCWMYLLMLVALIVVIRMYGDRNWLGTLLLFAPRWAALLPLLVLVPLAMGLNRRMLIVLGVAGIVAMFPLMGFNLGWRRFVSPPNDAMPMRIVAFNLHHTDLSGPTAIQFFTDTHPDVVALEEASGPSIPALFPKDTWHIGVVGELLLASRYPILSAKSFPDDFATEYRLQTARGPVDFIIVHLNSPHYALRDAIIGEGDGIKKLSRNIHERTQQAATLSRLSSQSTGPLIIAGDFNLLFDSRLLRSQFPGMTDTFKATGFGFGWTYQNHWTAVRIDRVLTSNNSFTPQKFTLGPWLGSPHRPIIADISLNSGG